jgi:hypothetical protein
MDYSKRDGGTRVHDKLKLRTLATGIGQSETAARTTGSHRAERVVAGMKPGQTVHDPGLRQQHEHMTAERERMATLHMDGAPPDPAEKFPLESGARSHHAAGTIAPPAARHNDQGEQKRRAVTGRAAHPSMQISPTVK